MGVMKKTAIIIGLATMTLLASVQAVKPRFCVAGFKDQKKCQLWSAAMDSNFTCVNGTDAKDCYTKIAKDQADIGLFGGAETFNAGKNYGLVVIAYEHRTYTTGNYINYYAVAVVRKGSALTLDNLQGSKSCHTGYGRNAGWKVPIGYLLQNGYMKWVNCDQFASAAAFFNQSCVPGSRGKDPTLCSLCKGKGINKCASNSKEPYRSHAGALKCLNETAGDVAFLKASVLLASFNPSDFRLLCPNSTQADPQDYKTCYLAKAPAHAFLARKNDTKISSYVAFLEKSSAMFGKSKPTNTTFELFDGEGIFKSADSLKAIKPPKQSDTFIHSSYLGEVSVLESCKSIPNVPVPNAGIINGTPDIIIAVFMFIVAKMMMI